MPVIPDELSGLASRPTEAVRPLTPVLATRLEALTNEMGEVVDLDAPIEGEVAL